MLRLVHSHFILSSAQEVTDMSNFRRKFLKSVPINRPGLRRFLTRLENQPPRLLDEYSIVVDKEALKINKPKAIHVDLFFISLIVCRKNKGIGLSLFLHPAKRGVA